MKKTISLIILIGLPLIGIGYGIKAGDGKDQKTLGAIGLGILGLVIALGIIGMMPEPKQTPKKS